jgi:Chitobiase/beta-hexosaminidase C-terminal domain
VTVQAQSTDDTTKTATFLFNVCANNPPTLANGTQSVIVAPAYQQAYQNQPMTLQSWVAGCSDETGTWSITSEPSGGNGSLADSTGRDTVFKASVTGRYTIQYTANCNSGTNTAIVYVSPNPLPSYASTPNGTRPHECYVDPALTGHDYEVGAGKAYATISSTPALTGWTPGTIMRVWNTDTTGSNPSVFHEYFNVQNSGTATQPIIICGVADSQGNLPIMDGTNATAQSDVDINAGGGMITLWPGANHYGYWQDGSLGPNYVSITGLHLRNANSTLKYYPPGSSNETNWDNFTACVNFRSGSFVDVSGNELDNCSNGLFSDDNDNNAWATITQNLTFIGNHVQLAGDPGYSNGTHQAYVQTFYALIEGNRFDNPTAYVGSQIKWRGVEGIFRYNYLGDGASRILDLVDNSDGAAYSTLEQYFSIGLYGYGDTAGANVIAAYQESEQKDFVYGNEMLGTSAQSQIHYAYDQDQDGLQNRNGILYFYSNTLDNAQIIFDNGFQTSGTDSYFQSRVDARNNILWASTVAWSGVIQMEFAQYATIILDATTNLMQSGTFTITTPILGAVWQDGTTEGWPSICDGPCPWPLTVPLNTHLYGLSAANYLTTSTQPYNATTFVPPSGSPAIGAGTALTGNPLAYMPVRWQYYVATGSLIPRVDPLTIGAADPSVTGPVAATPTFNPVSGTYATAQTVTISSATPGATIYYTTDGSTPTTASQPYSGPITVSTSETVSAIAAASGYANSAPGSATYIITLGQVATPAFSPGAGTYASAQSVTISDATAGATIYYTTNGTTPTTSSAVYSGPLTVSSTETIEAIATLSGYTNSAVAIATYTINLPQAATPAFTPGAGTYPSAQTVTISSATPSATIYYTINGTTPTTSSAVYSGPLTVSSTETIEAIATASSYANSAVASATYTINQTAADFSISASPTALTVTAGQSGTTTISVVPLNGFNSAVSFSCSSLPSGVACNFSPPTVTPSGAPASTTLTLTASATAAALHRNPTPFLPGPVLAVALCCVGWKKRRRLQMLLLLVASVAGICLLNGCGGGTFVVNGTRTPVTSTITVNAAAGSLQHTTTISLTVN